MPDGVGLSANTQTNYEIDFDNEAYVEETVSRQLNFDDDETSSQGSVQAASLKTPDAPQIPAEEDELPRGEVPDLA